MRLEKSRRNLKMLKPWLLMCSAKYIGYKMRYDRSDSSIFVQFTKCGGTKEVLFEDCVPAKPLVTFCLRDKPP